MDKLIRSTPWLEDLTEKENEFIKSFREILGESTVTSNEKTEKEKAINKLYKLGSLIGQSKSFKTYPSLSSSYYPRNMYNLLSYSFDQEIAKAGQPRNLDDW